MWAKANVDLLVLWSWIMTKPSSFDNPTMSCDVWVCLFLSGKDHESSLWGEQGLLQIFSFSCFLQPHHDVCCFGWGSSGEWVLLMWEILWLPNIWCVFGLRLANIILEHFSLFKLSLQKEPRFCFMETWFQTVYTCILPVIKQVKKLSFISKLSLGHPKRESKLQPALSCNCIYLARIFLEFMVFNLSHRHVTKFWILLPPFISTALCQYRTFLPQVVSMR